MAKILRAILFDLDNTLYDASLGLQEAGDIQITNWIMHRLNLPYEEADALRVRTWREYGATAKGLEAEYNVVPSELYYSAINTLEPRDFLRPDIELITMLEQLNASCHLFTNAPSLYARRVLKALAIEQYFDRIFDIEWHNWICKPASQIYEQALEDLGLPANEVALVEDNPRNLVPAAKLGMFTILIDGLDDPGVADIKLQKISDLVSVLKKHGISA